MIKRPMLATNAVIDELKYPLLASPKFDGIRCLFVGGKLLSRTFKPIPNVYIRTTLESLFSGIDGVLDGELIVGNIFQDTSSAVMSFEGEPIFKYYIFDYIVESPNDPYTKRMDCMKYSLYQRLKSPFIEYVFPTWINNYEQLCAYEQRCLDQGYEGCITRSPTSPYKEGRSTLKQQWMLKIKRFQDAEAIIIDFEELMHNANEAKLDNLGYTDHSTCKDNLVPMNTLGSLKVKDIETGIEFHIGSGFDVNTRQHIWNNRDQYIDAILTYKYQSVGIKDLPRFPVFKGFRNIIDID